MNRIVVFSHYDKNNIIQDYVIYYLAELKKISDKIIFVSDCDVSDNEQKKIEQNVYHFIIGKHGEYDFGSYKKGVLYCIKNNLLDNCDELIFANDSCFAPLFPLNTMFRLMETKNTDFWGVTMNKSNHFGGIKHIQTYFIVFKSKVFCSDIFREFILSITKQTCKDDIVLNYECGLTKILMNAGFSWDVYCDLSKKYQDTHIVYFKELIKNNKCPFLKRKIPILSSKIGRKIIGIQKFMLNNTDYNYFFDNVDVVLNIDFFKYFIKKYILKRKY